MPPEGIQRLRHEDILSFDEILDVVKEAVDMGVDKVRITGGEPLVRRGILDLVRMLAALDGIKDLSMTTNGIMLSAFAFDLKEAGLHRVNISLDTTVPEQFHEITRGGNIHNVFEGIESAKKAGLSPIKLNCVVKHSSSEENALQVKEYARKNNLEARFIHQMDLETGQYSVVEGGEGGHCARCNRLRLTANGIIKPCLFNTLGYSVREYGAKKALMLAVANKPKCGTVNHNEKFFNIGG
jgi:cyclic pyranopterin phosphate synthase